MYSNYLTLNEARAYLGIGKSLALKLCQEKPHGFPCVRIGKGRYQIDADLLAQWKADWFAGKFEI